MHDVISEIQFRAALDSVVPAPDGDSEGCKTYRAHHAILDRRVRIIVGRVEDLQPVRRIAAAAHPAIEPVYDYGEIANGVGFVVLADEATIDSATPNPNRSLRDDLMAAAQVAGAIGRAADQGLLRTHLTYEDILFLRGGRVLLCRSSRWKSSTLSESAGQGVVLLREMLSQILTFHDMVRGPLRAVLRHPYHHPHEVAGDLSCFLDGRRMRCHRNLAGRVRRLARTSPTQVATGLGIAVLGAALLSFARAETTLRLSRARQEDEIARAHLRQDQEEAISTTVGLMQELKRLNAERLALLGQIEKRYHQIESVEPDSVERQLAGRLQIADSVFESMARIIRSRLASIVDGDLTASAEELSWVLEEEDLTFHFRRAAFEERKILSSRSLHLLGATVPVSKSLSSGDLARAKQQIQALDEDHPYHDAVSRLFGALSAKPERTRRSSRWIDLLAARATVELRAMPLGSHATLQPVAIDDTSRWVRGASMSLPLTTVLVLSSGEYLVEVTHRGNRFRFPLLLGRGDSRVIDASRIPDEIPEGYEWIAASPFYCGGDYPGCNKRSRYRLCTSITRPFLIAREEATCRDYFEWIRRKPREKAASHIPHVEIGAISHTLLDQDLRVKDEIPGFVDDDLPVCGVSLSSAQEFAGDLAIPLEWRGTIPSAEQWELACRGVAGRLYPWGDEPLPERPMTIRSYQPVEKTGTPTEDVALTGVLRGGTNLREWTSSPSQATNTFRIKGAYWAEPTRSLADEADAPASLHSRTVGFRCAAISKPE